MLSSLQPTTLADLVPYVETACYTPVEALCQRAHLHLAELQKDVSPHAETLYTSLCQKLLGQIEQYLRLRRFGLIPYIHELLDKGRTGHNCGTCLKPCGNRHQEQISGLREAPAKIKETVFRLQSVALPIYAAETSGGEAYRNLRAEMMQLDTTLTELFYLEESSIIPKLLEAQRAINVGPGLEVGSSNSGSAAIRPD